MLQKSVQKCMALKKEIGALRLLPQRPVLLS